MTQLNPQMIADLARLAARYAPEEWERLIAVLDDERRRSQLSAALQELAAASRARREFRPRGAPKQPGPAKRLRAALTNLREVDPARADLLEDVWLKLRQRELLPTMALVRAFAEETGLKGLESTKREQAVTEVMEQIVDMPAEALEEMMRDTAVQDRQLGEEYEQWVRLILRQRSPTSDETPESRSTAEGAA
jgi:hypothetical protein